MVGKTGVEPATSTLSRWHSNQLSYFPIDLNKFYSMETIKSILSYISTAMFCGFHNYFVWGLNGYR